MTGPRSLEPLLVTSGLTRRFGGLKAVDGVDFTLMPGEIRAVIGPNGAGKTTFVGMICGRVLPSSGAVLFDGQDITGLPPHRRVRLGIAYTFQITSIFPDLSVYDNVALPVQRTVGEARGLRAAVMAALEKVGLAGRAAMPAGQLAYGHQRLLEVAMGLALKPRLLILDEPTQGLSDAEIEAFVGLVRDIAREATVLLIEHNMPLVMQLADRVTVLEAGRILAEGTPEQIRADAAVQAAYFGTPAGEPA